MNQSHLGEFEEVVLLTVAILFDKAYGIAILHDMEERIGRKTSIGSLQTVLKRLENKGYLTSEFGEVTKARGGKRKRYYTVTNFGRQLLERKRAERMRLWEAIPKLNFG